MSAKPAVAPVPICSFCGHTEAEHTGEIDECPILEGIRSVFDPLPPPKPKSERWALLPEPEPFFIHKTSAMGPSEGPNHGGYRIPADHPSLIEPSQEIQQ